MDVVVWLRSLGLGKYEAAFPENDIDETVLPNLTAEELKELGVASLGHRRKLLDAIAALRTDTGGKTPQLEDVRQLVMAREVLTSQPPAAAGAVDRVGALASAIERGIPSVSPLTTLLLALGALLLAHFVIIIHYDLSLIWLRIASLLLPFLFGFLYRQRTTEYLFGDLAVGVVLAVAAIFAMSAIVAKVDKVPILPIDAYGWREFIEYGASIAFAFFAGAVFRQTMIIIGTPTAKTSKLVYFAARYVAAKLGGVAPHDPRDPHMDKYLKRLGLAERVISASVVGGSALASIWCGLERFW